MKRSDGTKAAVRLPVARVGDPIPDKKKVEDKATCRKKVNDERGEDNG